MELLALLWSFFKIGVVSFGGGWSIVGLIKVEVVPRWMDEAGFSSLVAIAQVTPGPIALNAATLVGFRQAGIVGALLSTLSVIAFPVLSIVAVGFIARYVRPNEKALKESLRTGTLAMMLMTLWTLLPKSDFDPMLIFLGLAAFGLASFTKLNPLWSILGAGFLNAAFRAIFPAL